MDMDTTTTIATTEDIIPALTPLPFPAKVQPFFRGSVPLPPSQNHATKPIAVRTKTGGYAGKNVATPALQQFKFDAALMLTQAHYDWSLINAIRESRLKVPLAMEVRIYFPTMWKSDVDNRLKHTTDACFQKMQLNDNQIVDIHVVKEVDPLQPRVEIEVRCMVR